jgi:hypothetical protein
MMRRISADPRKTGEPLSTDNVPAEDRAVVNFATFQLFSIIYLEKFAVGPLKFQISVPLLIMFASLVWMIVTRSVTFSSTRISLYLIFVSCCLFAQVLANSVGSIPSMAELFLLYAFMTTSAPLSEAGYRRVLDNFIKLMIVPAVIILIQYGIQKITGRGDPISMTYLLPKSVLMQGYTYEAHFPNWNSPFQRPNGFFFLEPSFASFFTASAAIIELTFFRRPFFVIFTLIATALTQGGTGVTLLVLASPALLARESRRIVVPLVIVTVVGVFLAYLSGIQLPLISRLGELDQSSVGAGYESSGALRLIIPWNNLIELLSNPSYLFTGTGAGSTGPSLGNPWPILKLTREYGIIAMISYVVFVASAFTGKYNVPLKIAAWVVFNFTGGYLLDPSLILFFSVVFCIIEPVTRDKEVEEFGYKWRNRLVAGLGGPSGRPSESRRAQQSAEKHSSLVSR